VVAVQRVYLDADHDPETGVLRLSELRTATRRPASDGASSGAGPVGTG
jgi:hypothetical protein